MRTKITNASTTEPQPYKGRQPNPNDSNGSYWRFILKVKINANLSHFLLSIIKLFTTLRSDFNRSIAELHVAIKVIKISDDFRSVLLESEDIAFLNRCLSF